MTASYNTRRAPTAPADARPDPEASPSAVGHSPAPLPRPAKASPRTLANGNIITPSTDPYVVDPYKLLRTRVLRRMQKNGWKTLAVTSSRPKEGKTHVAINLAISIAMDLSHSALLIDADLRRPSINKRMGLGSGSGLGDYLQAAVPLEKTLVSPSIERLTVLPGSTPIRNASELLRSPRMRALLEEERDRYEERILVIDLPPVLVGDDAIAITPYVDAVLLVVEDAKTSIAELARAADLLSEAELLGSVLNRSTDANNRYDYYY